MSTKPRTPEHFPRMKHRAAKRQFTYLHIEVDLKPFIEACRGASEALAKMSVAYLEAGRTLSPPPNECTCFPVENPWTYYGIVEPGGAWEPNPDCPEHFPTTEAAPNRAASYVPWEKS